MNPEFDYLNGQTVVQAEVSDHNPIISGPVMTFNIMMQGKYRERNGVGRFNNGFGMVAETDAEYHSRLKHIVAILAEAAHNNPHLHAIAIQEGPVREADIAVFKAEMAKFKELDKFASSLDKRGFTPWGVAVLADDERYASTALPAKSEYTQRPFKDRVLEVKLTEHSTGNELSLSTLHAPFDVSKGDEGLETLVAVLKSLVVSSFIVGDFNLEPHLLSSFLTHFNSFVVPEDNSVLAISQGTTVTGKRFDTVDGVLSVEPTLKTALTKQASHRFMERAKMASVLLSSKSAAPLTIMDDSAQQILKV